MIAAVDAPIRSSPSNRISAMALLALNGGAMLLKQTVPLIWIDVPVAPPLWIASTGLVLLELAPALTRGRGGLAVRLLITNLLVSIVAEADLISFRITRRFVSVLQLPLLSYVPRLGPAIASGLRPGDLFLFADLLLLAAATLVSREQSVRESVQRWPVLAALGLGLLTVSTTTDPYWRTATWRNPATAGRVGLVGYHALTVGSSLVQSVRARMAPDDDLPSLQRWYASRRAAPVASAPLPRFDRVIVLQVESLQGFALGLTVGGQEITPNLNALRRRAVVFTHAYSQVGEGNTSDAEWLSLCSLYPAENGIAFVRFSGSTLRCLPNLLRERGLSTFAFHGNGLEVYNRREMYAALGFEHRLGREEIAPAARGRYELPDATLFDAVLARLQGSERFAAHVVTFSSHRPFRVPPQHLPLGALAGSTAGDYLESLHYVDAEVGKFLAELEKRELLRRTLVVIYGDHAGLTRSDPGLSAMPLARGLDEAGWFEVEHRVPLMFVGEGLPPAEIDTPAGQLDIAPTIAGLMGISTEGTGFLGRDLLRTGSRPVLFWNGSAADADHVRVEGRAPWPLCFTRSGRPEPTESCDSLSTWASSELRASRLMLNDDLVTSLDR